MTPEQTGIPELRDAARRVVRDYHPLRRGPQDLLKRDHSLNGGVLWGLEGHFIEIQARAVEVLKRPVAWQTAVSITGMAILPIETKCKYCEIVSNALAMTEERDMQTFLASAGLVVSVALTAQAT